MTIAIKITNEDSREKAVVEVKTASPVTKSLFPKLDNLPRSLRGGESVTMYVHSGQSLVVEELENG